MIAAERRTNLNCGLLLALLVLAPSVSGWSLFGSSSRAESVGASGSKAFSNRRIAPGVKLEAGHLVMDSKRERATFDPEVAVHEEDSDLEYLGYDEDEWYESEDDRNNYWHDFNATERLQELFPKIDTNKDGFIAKSEIHFWHHSNARNASLRRAELHFNSSDENGDAKVTLKEYLAEFYHQFLEMEEFPEEETDDLHRGDWQYFNKTKESFRLVDANNDGGLQMNEFYDFQQPEESNNAALHRHIMTHDIINYDENDNGVIEREEYVDGLWHMFYTWTDDEDYDWSEEVDRQRAEERFKILDTNRDGVVSVDELMPYYFELHPTEGYYARVQADDLVGRADTDLDGRLTLAEMLAKPEVFYNMAHGRGRHYDNFDYHDYQFDYHYDL
mmetsp:Transcript_47867/g.119854  ORF Transcript_47867/g.119854 Transcript_47867/m.119854 type:complete len:388 (-) Transcript_47867:350-1513(-)